MHPARKVQTVKDLRVLWSKLPTPEPPFQPYSAFNTILLDDSALKAHLQPYNHLCLPEYEATRRRDDLAALVISSQSGDPDVLPNVDRSLIAIVGILHELSHQESVCGWIHSGGLWAGHTEQLDESAFEEAEVVDASTPVLPEVTEDTPHTPENQGSSSFTHSTSSPATTPSDHVPKPRKRV